MSKVPTTFSEPGVMISEEAGGIKGAVGVLDDAAGGGAASALETAGPKLPSRPMDPTTLKNLEGILKEHGTKEVYGPGSFWTGESKIKGTPFKPGVSDVDVSYGLSGDDPGFWGLLDSPVESALRESVTSHATVPWPPSESAVRLRIQSGKLVIDSPLPSSVKFGKLEILSEPEIVTSKAIEGGIAKYTYFGPEDFVGKSKTQLEKAYKAYAKTQEGSPVLKMHTLTDPKGNVVHQHIEGFFIPRGGFFTPRR